MTEYHKIQTIFKRDMTTKHKTLMEGQWSLPEFEYLADNEWLFEEKVDGTNIRVFFHKATSYGYGVSFGGRTDKAVIPSALFDQLGEIFLPKINKMSKMFDHSVVFYGEGYGANIQSGVSYRKDQSFVLFDVRVGNWWLQRDAVADVANKLGIEVVPNIGKGSLFCALDMAKNGFKSAWGDFQAEGIIARPRVELCTRGGGRIIAKIKCRDFQK